MLPSSLAASNLRIVPVEASEDGVDLELDLDLELEEFDA